MKGFFHAGNTAGYTYEKIFFASIIRQAQTIRHVIPKRAVPTGNLSKTAGKTSVVSAVMQKTFYIPNPNALIPSYIQLAIPARNTPAIHITKLSLTGLSDLKYGTGASLLLMNMALTTRR